MCKCVVVMETLQNKDEEHTMILNSKQRILYMYCTCMCISVHLVSNRVITMIHIPIPVMQNKCLPVLHT